MQAVVAHCDHLSAPGVAFCCRCYSSRRLGQPHPLIAAPALARRLPMTVHDVSVFAGGPAPVAAVRLMLCRES